MRGGGFGQCLYLVQRRDGPMKTSLWSVSFHRKAEEMLVGFAWQRLARSHRLFTTPHCHPLFRFRPSLCEVPLIPSFFSALLFSQQHAVMEILLAQSLEQGMRLSLNASPFLSTLL
jgi:hypothetical protein